MSRRNIKKYSFSYAFVHVFGTIFHWLYYRRLRLINRSNIPKGKPVIFAINHQNALMDALAIVFTHASQPVFMARADIFRKKSAARILYFLKILPAYRIRDGFHSVDQNKQVFEEVVSVLEHGRPVGILPEGNHYGEKRLRCLKKGAGRLALMAEEANGFKFGLSIVPVGLDYSNYYNAGSDLLVNYGKPIYISDYKDQYLENPVQAVNVLRDDLTAAMKEVMIDISSEEYYKTIYSSIELFGPIELKRRKSRSTLLNEFKVKKELSESLLSKLPDHEPDFINLKNEIESYQKKIKKYKIKERTVRNNTSLGGFILRSLIALILLPLHLYGMVLNYLPYGLPVRLARKIKDKHFVSSVRFVLGLVFFFFWYLILIITSFFVFDSLYLTFAFIISLPLTGLFSFYFYVFLLRLMGEYRLLGIKMKSRRLYEDLIGQRKKIIGLVEELLK